MVGHTLLLRTVTKYRTIATGCILVHALTCHVPCIKMSGLSAVGELDIQGSRPLSSNYNIKNNNVATPFLVYSLLSRPLFPFYSSTIKTEKSGLGTRLYNLCKKAGWAKSVSHRR